MEQNRLLALEQRGLRRGGAILAPVTTKLSLMDSISLRGGMRSLPGMIPLHHAFGVKGPCQHQVIGLVNDAAAVVQRDGFDDFGFAFGVAFNLDTNWGQDVFGGSRCEPGAGACSASQQLLLEYMFPAFGPEVSNRIALQLKFYQKEVGPVLSVLHAPPCLHFMLPSPCETTQQLANWRFQVQSTCWFLKMVGDKCVGMLELALLLFYQKSIDLYTFFADMILSAKSSPRGWAECMSRIPLH